VYFFSLLLAKPSGKTLSDPKGGLWVVVVRLNDSFGELGYAIVGLVALSWVVSMAVYKWRGFDKI